ncbi:hypothetical protein GBAR_LOCUS477, partial [Geodia barretti]
MVFGCLQEGLKSLQGKSVCEHLQTVLPRLSSGGKIHFSTSGPPTPDNSLLNNADFWGSASLQHSQHYNEPVMNNAMPRKKPAGIPPTYIGADSYGAPGGQDWDHVSREYTRPSHQDILNAQKMLEYWNTETDIDHHGRQKRRVYIQEGEVIFASAAEGNAVSLTTALFPSLSSSSLPPNKLLNISFSCATGQLDVHVQLSGTLVLIPQVLSFTDVTLSVRMHIGSKVTFNTLILSGETQLFGTNTFVAVKYDPASKKFSVPPSLVLSVNQISSHISSFKTTLDTLPSTASELLSSRITAFSYDPQTMELSLSTTVPQVSLIPNVIMLTNAKFSVQAAIGSSPSLKSLMFSGMWQIGKTSLVTNLKYNGPKKLFHVTATSGGSSTLSAKDLVQKIAGNSYDLPSKLSLFTLKQIVGNIYDNGKYFIALQGTVPDG